VGELVNPGKCAYAAALARLSFDRRGASLASPLCTLPEDRILSHSDPATGLPVGPRPEHPVTPDYTSEQVLATVLASVDDDKAEDIVQIDLRGRSDVADYMVICSGRSTRQVAAISEKLADRLKQEFRISARMEGKETADWVLIDASDVVIHVFRPEVREFYQLEKMWLPVGSMSAGVPRAAKA
jgi:ribosome-associated protein